MFQCSKASVFHVEVELFAQTQSPVVITVIAHESALSSPLRLDPEMIDFRLADPDWPVPGSFLRSTKHTQFLNWICKSQTCLFFCILSHTSCQDTLPPSPLNLMWGQSPRKFPSLEDTVDRCYCGGKVPYITMTICDIGRNSG